MGEIDDETLKDQGSATDQNAAVMRQWLTDETGLKERKGSHVEHGRAMGTASEATSSTRPVAAAGAAGLWAEQLLCDKRVAALLQDFDSTITWGFDVFEFELACVEARGPAESRPAALLTYAILDRCGTIEQTLPRRGVASS
jgi:hypothetical protein